MLHGFGAHHYSWRYLTPELRKRFRIHLLDLKGFGRSEKPLDKQYTVRDQATLVTDYIKRLGNREIYLAGHSFGGGVALAVTRRLPLESDASVKKLVLIDSMAYPQKLPIYIRPLTLPWIGYPLMALLPAKTMVRYVLRLAYHQPARIPKTAITEYARPLATPGAAHALIHTARDLRYGHYEVLYNSYSEIACPTLIIWGVHDRIVPLAVGARLSKTIPNNRFVQIEDCGHNPMEEKANDCLNSIREFLY
jgi:pimeloyl-ACP methyl ester carboxylesterase